MVSYSAGLLVRINWAFGLCYLTVCFFLPNVPEYASRWIFNNMGKRLSVAHTVVRRGLENLSEHQIHLSYPNHHP